mmetsp:Transcript_12406/g.20140  ORF Transcript_12406/g.20140 Transcript_12406/m.20140 type:complete len:355 (-) Transcript_12406:53-1117(-)
MGYQLTTWIIIGVISIAVVGLCVAICFCKQCNSSRRRRTSTHNGSAAREQARFSASTLVVSVRYNCGRETIAASVPLDDQGGVAVVNARNGKEEFRYPGTHRDYVVERLVSGKKRAEWWIRGVKLGSSSVVEVPSGHERSVVPCPISLAGFPFMVTVLGPQGPMAGAQVSVSLRANAPSSTSAFTGLDGVAVLELPSELCNATVVVNVMYNSAVLATERVECIQPFQNAWIVATPGNNIRSSSSIQAPPVVLQPDVSSQYNRHPSPPPPPPPLMHSSDLYPNAIIVAPSSPPLPLVTSGSDLCIICNANPRQVALDPCGHVALCADDALVLEQSHAPCPICRRPITKILRLFVS